MSTFPLSEAFARAGKGRPVGISRWHRPAPFSSPGKNPSGVVPPTSTAYQTTPVYRQPPTVPALSSHPALPSTPTTQNTFRRSWIAPLAGVAAGLGLAHLFGSASPAYANTHPAGSSLNWLWVLVGIAGIAWLIKRKRAHSLATNSSTTSDTTPPNWRDSNTPGSAFSDIRHTISFEQATQEKTVLQNPVDQKVVPTHITPEPKRELAAEPVISDTNAFLEAAKQYFTSLQSAFDKGDLDPFRDWMVPELLADLSSQIQERNGVVSQTEILSLNALIIDQKAAEDANWVSVRFSGTSRESFHPDIHAFNEAWHFRQSRYTSNDPWKLAGIEPIEE